MTVQTKRWGVIGLGILLLNVLTHWQPLRIDLTEDKRFTMTEATRRLLSELNVPVQVTVYLSGDFPPGFERLEGAIRQTLEEFKQEANGQLSYRFVDPSAHPTEEQRQAFYAQLIASGLTPTNLHANEGGKRTERLIFPGAVLEVDTVQLAVQLLKGNRSYTAEEQLNQSYENVEFELSSAIRQLTQASRSRVGLVVSHTNLPPSRLSDLIATLQQQYDVFLDINTPSSYDGLDALLVVKPDRPFSEEELYKLDQYVVKGGSAFFLVDGAKVDSVSLEGTFAQPLDLGLNSLFFRWGMRLNTDLVKDLNAALIPLNVGAIGDRPQIQPLPWRFFPLLNRYGEHPITRNVEAVYSRFLSSIDTVGGVSGIRKTPLIWTSPYTKTLTTPALVSYNEARQQPSPEEYQGGEKISAVLLEGAFRSVFQNRILPSDPRYDSFVPEGKGGKVIVVADGDIALNDVDYRRNAPLPIGYDRVSQQIFGNKEFILHAIDYLSDPEGLISARVKQVAIRPLDKLKIADQRLLWQLLNMALPMLLLGCVGVIHYALRRRKYAR